ncbi:MAG TPA: hypothetical protein VGN63_13240 [Flavisolibacter sp.]|jgi:hypothetical protein|nr:hypothetical protein [Flavisolibacter sp.]
MAKQKGIFKVEGTLDDVTFYKSKDGYLVREKGGVSAERIASDPAFIRTRENQAEFGRAGKAGKTLRAAFRVLLQNASDARMVSRLHREMMKVVKADATSARGQRNVLDGELELLTGFEFNAGGKLSQTLFAPFVAAIDRVSGELKIEIPSFVPLNQIGAPKEATHYQILGGGGAIDFEAGLFTAEANNSAVLPLDGSDSVPLSLLFAVAPNSTQPLFVVLGIAFFQEVNGSHYSLKNGAYNALAVVRVNGG